MVFLSAIAQQPVYNSMLPASTDPENPKLAGRRRVELAVNPVKFRLNHRLYLTGDHQFFDLCNRLGGVQPFGAGAGAVHNGVATIELKRIFKIIQPLTGGLVTAVDDPAVGM